MYWCPGCLVGLVELAEAFRCPKCDHVYPLRNGFCVFDDSELVSSLDYGLSQEKIDIEREALLSRLHSYLLPHLNLGAGCRILAVGCGAGSDVEELNRLGAEAYGMDFLYRTRDWKARDLSKHRFFISSTAKLPFPWDHFDLVLCMGVIEHVSEFRLGRREYRALARERRDFLQALFGLLKSGGSLIVTSPNRSFPIDFQHDHGMFPLLARLSIYPHSPFTRFLESYHSVSRYLREIGEHRTEPMPLGGFFQFNVFRLSPPLRLFGKLFKAYIWALDHSPDFIRRSFLNPYIVLKIRKVASPTVHSPSSR